MQERSAYSIGGLSSLSTSWQGLAIAIFLAAGLNIVNEAAHLSLITSELSSGLKKSLAKLMLLPLKSNPGVIFMNYPPKLSSQRELMVASDICLSKQLHCLMKFYPTTELKGYDLLNVTVNGYHFLYLEPRVIYLISS
jgi:hypothetical protein